MSREIVQTLNVKTPSTLAEFIELGRVLFMSGMFKDLTNAQMAVGKMVVGQHMGLDPVQSLTGIHMVQGMPQLHYRTLLAKVRMHPDYDYEITENTPNKVSIEFFRKGESCGVSTFTLDDAKRQGTQNMQKFPQNMLIARATSNGVGWYCPDVVFGVPVYTDGDIMDMGQDDYQDVSASPKDQLKAELSAMQELPPSSTPNGDVVVPPTQEDVAPVEGAPGAVVITGEGQASVSAADPASPAPAAEVAKEETVEVPVKPQPAKAPKEEKPATDGAPAADPLEAAFEPYDFKPSQKRMLAVEAAERGIDLAATLAACEDKTWGGALFAITGIAQG